MKDFYYLTFIPFISSVKRAISRARHIIRFRLCVKREAYDWSQDDHQHICLAVRLLSTKDFAAVCPRHGLLKEIEYNDRCDSCKYMAIINYRQSNNGRRCVELHGYDSVLKAYKYGG